MFYTTEIGVDVTLSSDPLVFTFGVDSLPGNLSCANVTIDDDSAFESNHSFRVELDNLVVVSADPLLVIDSPNSTIITILDNDGKYGSLGVILFCLQPLMSLLSVGTIGRG